MDDRASTAHWERRIVWFAFGLVVGLALSALWFKAQIEEMAETMTRVRYFDHRR